MNPLAATEPTARTGLFTAAYRGSSLAFAAVNFLVGFAALALVTTMPLAVRALHGLNLYPLAFGGFVTASLFGSVLAGRLADRAGPHAPLAAGLVLSVTALLVCGGAGSVWQLVAGRLLDGLAGGLVVVSVNVTVARTYPAELRPRALSLMSVSWIVPSMAGPPIAGLVCAATSWRWVFFGLALPTAAVAAAAFLVARRRMAERETGAEATELTHEGWGRVRIAAVLAVGAGLLQYAGSGRHPVQLAAAIAGLVLLVPTAPRLLSPGTLRAAVGLPAVVLLSGVCSGVYFTLESFVPLLLIDHRHVPAWLAGVAFTGATLGWAGASWFQGHTLSAVPRRRLVAVGTVANAIATVVAIIGVAPAAPRLTAALALVTAGAGMGLVVPSLTVLVFEYCRPQEQGRYSAALQVSQSLGQVLAMALAGALYDARAAGAAFVWVFVLVFALAVGARLIALRTRAADATPNPPNHQGG